MIDRHDILRTAFVWEGFSSAAQVVWREAPLSIDELTLDPVEWAGAREQLAQQFDPRSHRLDLPQAPLLRFFIAYDPENNRWLLLQSHAPPDRGSLHPGFPARRGPGDSRRSGPSLAAPQPFRHVSCPGAAGYPRQDHERFFRAACWGMWMNPHCPLA